MGAPATRLVWLCLAAASLAACGSSRQVAGHSMVVTGALVAGSALASSSDPVLLSDDVGTTRIAYVSRRGFSTTDAILVTGGAGLMAVGQALLQSSDPPPAPIGTAVPAQAPAVPAPAATTPPSRGVVDPAVIRAACESALEQ